MDYCEKNTDLPWVLGRWKCRHFLLQGLAQAHEGKGADISNIPALLSSTRPSKRLLSEGSPTLSTGQEILHTPGLLWVVKCGFASHTPTSFPATAPEKILRREFVAEEFSGWLTPSYLLTIACTPCASWEPQLCSRAVPAPDPSECCAGCSGDGDGSASELQPMKCSND